MVDNIDKTFSIHDFQKLFMSQCFSTKGNINTFDVLTFIQMRADENKL